MGALPVQEGLHLIEEAKPLAQAYEAWATAWSAEHLAIKQCIGHFKTVTEQIALRASPATSSTLPHGRLQSVPAFDLESALEQLPSSS